MSESWQPLTVPIRSRLGRAVHWPSVYLRYRRAGASRRSAWRLTHWIIWYAFIPPPAPPSDPEK